MAYLCTHLMKTDRGVEQLVARWAHNPKVIGSSPISATKGSRLKFETAFICLPGCGSGE